MVRKITASNRERLENAVNSIINYHGINCKYDEERSHYKYHYLDILNKDINPHDLVKYLSNISTVIKNEFKGELDTTYISYGYNSEKCWILIEE